MAALVIGQEARPWVVLVLLMLWFMCVVTNKILMIGKGWGILGGVMTMCCPILNGWNHGSMAPMSLGVAMAR